MVASMGIKVGFLINPIAGMGGAVGLKGTDGPLYLEALRRGARPEAHLRALRFLKRCLEIGLFNSKDVTFIVANGVMGCKYFIELGISEDSFKCLGIPKRDSTTSDDTKACVREFIKYGVDVIVFVGGDGTARDIIEVTKGEVPLIGVPAGVKMYSACFAVSPESAADLLNLFIKNQASINYVDIVDVDEYSIFASDRLRLRTYGKSLAISHKYLVTSSKELIRGDEVDKEGIAEYFIEEYFRHDVPYILGPGSTVKYIADKLGVPKTLLGFDAVLGKRLIGKDLSEKDILYIISNYGIPYVVLSVIGGQGFIIGRGNKQLTARVLRIIGKNRIIVVATKAKLLHHKYLLIETGDIELDEKLSGYWRVITGYREETIVRVLPASKLHIYSCSIL